MLGYIVSEGRGEADRCMAVLAERLAEEGIPAAGVFQINTERDDGQPCDMDLKVIGAGRVIRISQSLGPGAAGCRLDPAGLEEAVGLVAASLDTGQPRILLANRFGRREVEGKGFRPLIGRAVGEGVIALTAVGVDYLPDFEAFAGGMASRLPADANALLDWCRSRLAIPFTPE